MIKINSKFDLIIIGSGSASTTAAFKVQKAGKKVAVIDQKPIGGTCALRGCDPKKILVGVTDALESAKRLREHGISALKGEINWEELIKFKKSFTDSMSRGIEQSLLDSGIKIFRGRAKFTGHSEVEVDGNILEGEKFLIASGTRAAPLEIPGSEFLVDNEEFLNLKILPDNIVFVGGGYISVEFASIATKAGSKATILQHSDRILVNFDGDLSEMVSRQLSGSGVNIITGSSVTKIVKAGKAFEVHFVKDGKDMSVPADLVVHGAGRNFDPEMDPEKGGLKWSRKGITVNDYLQSVSNANVYAAGDSADTDVPKLTPVAIMEGSIAADNILNGNSLKPIYDGIPTAVFSSPPLAMVGLTEDESVKRGIQVEVKKGEMTFWYNSRRRMVPGSFFKILLEKDTGKILGAHILGESSEEVINIFALAIRLNLDVETLLSVQYTYPSDTNDIRYMIA